MAACLAAMAVGCAMLPPPVPRPSEAAITDTGATRLSRLASASMAAASGRESGFRLLPTGDFAFDAGVALARRAERSLDVRYYQLEADSVGLRFLRELRDAAQRGVRVRLLNRKRVIAGSLNLDPRSAWSNTESALLIESPDLATDIYQLVASDRNESTYRLRLAADGETIEWVATDGEGKAQVFTDEPRDDWLHRLKMLLLSPFVGESML